MTPCRTLIFACAILASALEAAERSPRLEFTRMVAHWSKYSGPEYLEFIDEVNPELVQLGFYGGHFWSLGHTSQFGGYPMHLPVQGLVECGKWFEQKNKELRKRKIITIGHFNVEFLVGDPDGPDGPRGFFKFYRELWDEAELGPKPVEDPLDFMERNKDGTPRKTESYKIGGMAEYWACLRNPNWRAVLKAWVSRGIERGVDGYIANYFYRHDCHCEHCQAGFREYLNGRHSPEELSRQFGIENLETHEFDEIVCWHKPEESTPLRREMLRWSQISNKAAFDEVFIEHGRSLKSDLIVSQWNHLSNFSQIKGDERCLLPAELWGKGEDYTWYSMGASGVYTDLKNGVLADGTLQARYIRGAFEDKPFTLGKYEGVRIRTAIAELAANGGSPMGFYARVTDPEAREIFKTYYGFLERYDSLYHANQSYAESFIEFPRKAVWEGNLEPLEWFRQEGKRMLDNHLLFDVIPDDLVTPTLAARYGAGVRFENPELSSKMPTKISAPHYVRVSGSVPAAGGEIDLHFVNYNREELPPNPKNGRPNPGRGAKDENPIAIPKDTISVEFALPAGQMATAVEFITPEEPESVALAHEEEEQGLLSFSLPSFLVYGIVRIKLAPRDPDKLPKIAGIATIYRTNSHGEMLIGRLAQTESLNDAGRILDLNLTGVFTDQIPESDVSRKFAAENRFKIHETIADTLREGGDQLVVDGILLVAEHGEYEKSDTGQTLYPKRRLFGEIAKVIEEDKNPVPLFCDKHLADNWEDAKWLYDEAKRLEIPLMAGSSLPVAWRVPAADVAKGATLKEIVAVSYGSLDAYGFHGLEMIQCLAERRKGGETGVKRVRCLTGPEVWQSDFFNRELFDEVLASLRNRRRLERGPVEEIMKEPVLFAIEYADGLRASLLTLNGAVAEWAVAWRNGDDSMEATVFALQEKRPYSHFTHLMHGVEKMMHSGKPTWPAERTLLTSGILDAALISKRDGGEWLETPYLDVKYSTDWTWSQPPPPPAGWRLPRKPKK